MTGAITRGRALRGDLSLWDGISSTSTRIDASGGTVTGVPVGDSVDVLQVYGSGSSRTKSAIDQAIGAIGTVREATLSFAPGTWTITDNLTIPSNFAAFIPRGCHFDISSGKTLTFSGPVTSESDSFSIGSGEVVFSVNSIVNGDVWIVETAAEIAAGVTPTNYAYAPGNVLRYGENTTPGTTDMRAAIQAAVTVAIAGGLDAIVPSGTYLIGSVAGDSRSNGIVFPWDSNFDNRAYVRLLAQGNVIFKASANNQVVVRVSRTFVEVSGIHFDKNGHTGVTNIGIIPESTTQTTTQVSQSYFMSRDCSGDGAIGYEFQPGPQVGGSDSGNFYHRIYNPDFNGCLVCFKFNQNVDYGTHPNYATRTVIYHPTMINANCGVYADAVGDLTLIEPEFELITAAGTLGTATGLYVTAHGSAAKDIRIFGGYFEACTRDIDTANTRCVAAFGTIYSDAKVAGTGTYNIVRLDRDKLQLSYDAAGAGGQMMATSTGGLDTMGDPGNSVSSTVLRRGVDGTYYEAITPYHKASDASVGISGSYHEKTSGSPSNPATWFKHTHASAPHGIRVTYTAASPNDTGQYFLYCEDATNSKAIIFSNGDFQSRTNSYGAISDEKLKENIAPVTGYWNQFKQFQYVHFNFRDDPDKKKMLGLIAQQVESIAPGLVSTSPDKVIQDGEEVLTGTQTKAVKYSVVTMQAEIVLQEAQRRIEQLEARLAAAGIR